MGYVINHCISHFQKEQEEKAYKDYFVKGIGYIAQGVEFMSGNVAAVGAYYHGSGQYLAKSFNDVIEDKPEDNRTAEEIVDDVLEKCGLGG